MLDVTVPFKKRTDVLINGFQYYDTTTQTQETIEFYNYYDHLKRLGFIWEYTPMQFKYEITLSIDVKTLTKKITVSKSISQQISVDKSRITLRFKKDLAVKC